jgi:cobalt-zinc-cadmium efflux system protein
LAAPEHHSHTSHLSAHPSGTGAAPTRSTRHLAVALGLTAGFAIIELVGGLWTHSLALLSDAGHMFGDIVALTISLFALHLARRPPTASKTFGYHRVEILAAFVNGLGLWLIVGLIFHEALQRFAAPPPVRSAGMTAIAAAGLLVNVASLLVLHPSRQSNLNLRAAFLHVLSDALGSVGALVAGTVMLTTGWYVADPLASIGIGVLILYNSWGIVRESVDILMQGTPRDMRLEDVECCLLAIGGVRQVHDLHVWTLTSGRYLLSVHLVVDGDADPRQVIDSAQRSLWDRFEIGHATVQIEPEAECVEAFRPH